ncbi:7971_t:CDS:2 [Funneliformis geosporum]|nr:7971_t:CDS:2 [Funneliformis geosporum]
MSRHHDNKYQPSLLNSISTQLVNISQQESQVTELQLENSILKSNLSDNYEKLNNALVAVAQMQRLFVHHEFLPENRLINIAELIKPALSDYFNDNTISSSVQQISN